MKLFTTYIILLCIALSTSCTYVESEAKQQTQETQVAELQSQTITIEGIIANQSTYLNKPILLTATFKGWKGSCKGAPPVSRSDWMIEDGTGCIYVTGKLPLGQSSITPKEVTVTIKGIVKKSTNGIIYIQSF